jgi:hypothetical protein
MITSHCTPTITKAVTTTRPIRDRARADPRDLGCGLRGSHPDSGLDDRRHHGERGDTPRNSSTPP